MNEHTCSGDYIWCLRDILDCITYVQRIRPDLDSETEKKPKDDKCILGNFYWRLLWKLLYH
jgi:hypothetical protein